MTGLLNRDAEKISSHLERVQLYIEANGVEYAKKVAVLLTVMGSNSYGLLEKLGLVVKKKRNQKPETKILVRGSQAHFLRMAP